RGARVFALNRDALAAGTKTSDEFVARLKSVLDEAASSRGRVVLFVPDFHQFAGTYTSHEASDLVRSALERGDLRIIGATNPDIYKEHVAQDSSFAKLLQPVELSGDTASTDKDESAGITMSEERLSPDLREMIGSAKPGERVGVILQADDLQNPELASLLRRYNVEVKSRMEQIGAMRVEVPAAAIKEFAKSGAASYISPDRPMLNLGHLTATTGTDLVRTQPAGSLIGGLLTGGTTTLDGTGISIAVIDSGIDTGHAALAGRVTYSKDFTGENLTDKDPYGHGTHVASAAAGLPASTAGVGSSYQGIATGAKIVNLRVLKSDGTGSTSSLLAALNWILSPQDPTKPLGGPNTTNAVKYNIRVVNMSLGSPAVDSYKNDAVCKAARALVDAGIVVVAAAGNNGKDSQGNKLYGQIHSPGDEPSVITVGAVNTFGTDARNDDGIASYSSRGPTRGYTTDASGVKHFDNLIKPDLSAPGNKIINAESDLGGGYLNVLVTQHPELDASVKDQDNKRYMYLSGTSMATPAVAGAAALLLQANPKLTPNMVKMILMYTAQPLAGFNELEQGSGELNVEGAVRLAKLVRTNMTTTTKQGDPLLTTSTLPTPSTTIAGYQFPWAQGVILKQNYATGTNLIAQYQTVYGLGMVIGDGYVASSGSTSASGIMMSDGITMGDQITTSAGMVIGDGAPFMACGILMGDGILMSDGMVVGDGIMMSDGMVVGDGILMSDAALQAMSAGLQGDDGAAMPKPPADPSN
ncbi:MAG TPA: S8 family serine peptidase, partial [Pyrinomonadaceae bacterium]|nr:S8 family serine peptidase [Pyrinomonadaceae bacterium]